MVPRFVFLHLLVIFFINEATLVLKVGKCAHWPKHFDKFFKLSELLVEAYIGTNIVPQGNELFHACMETPH